MGYLGSRSLNWINDQPDLTMAEVDWMGLNVGHPHQDQMVYLSGASFGKD